MRSSRLVAFVCAAALGCAGTAPEEEPAWLKQARAREAKPQPLQKLAAPKGAFRGKVAARVLEPPRREGESHFLSLGIGSDAPIECWIYDDELDLASSLQAFSEASFATISEHFGEVELRRIEGVDAGAIGGGPFLAVDWLYRVRGGESAQVGQIKHLAVSRAGHTTYCQHNELGYEASFRGVVEGLVRDLVFAGKPPRPYYEEISTFSVQELRVGVQHVTLQKDKDGDTRIDLRSFMLVPVDASSLQASDTYGVEFVRPDGSLINQVHVETQNGEIASHLELDPHAEGWKVKGTFQTKPIEAEIPAAKLGSWLAEVLSVRREIARRGVGGEVVLKRWLPDADPTRFVDEKIAILERVEGDRYRTGFSSAGIEAEVVADRSGSAKSGSFELGHIEMRFERVVASGKL